MCVGRKINHPFPLTWLIPSIKLETRGIMYRSAHLTRGIMYRSAHLTSGIMYRSAHLTSAHLTRGIIYRSAHLTRGIMYRSAHLTRGIMYRSAHLTRGIMYGSAYLRRGIIYRSPHLTRGIMYRSANLKVNDPPHLVQQLDRPSLGMYWRLVGREGAPPLGYQSNSLKKYQMYKGNKNEWKYLLKNILE